jgi:hypothetical protein
MDSGTAENVNLPPLKRGLPGIFARLRPTSAWNQSRDLNAPRLQTGEMAYQTRQDAAGYMGWPLVQPKALPN